MDTWAVIVAGGSGARFGSMKQLENLGDKRVLDWSIAAMAAHCSGLVVVVPPALVDSIAATVDSAQVVAGGDSRAGSVRAGLAAVGSSATHVLVHDAARPLVSEGVIRRVLSALNDGADGAIPVVPVTDTLRTVSGDPVDRSEYVAVQTPQGFAVDVLNAAHDGGGEATDDATLVTANGGNVVHVEGDPKNLKITVPQDIAIAEALL